MAGWLPCTRCGETTYIDYKGVCENCRKKETTNQIDVNIISNIIEVKSKLIIFNPFIKVNHISSDNDGEIDTHLYEIFIPNVYNYSKEYISEKYEELRLHLVFNTEIEPYAHSIIEDGENYKIEVELYTK